MVLKRIRKPQVEGSAPVGGVKAQTFCQQLEQMGSLGYLQVGRDAKQRFNAVLSATNIIAARNRTARKIISSLADNSAA